MRASDAVEHLDRFAAARIADFVSIPVVSLEMGWLIVKRIGRSFQFGRVDSPAAVVYIEA